MIKKILLILTFIMSCNSYALDREANGFKNISIGKYQEAIWDFEIAGKKGLATKYQSELIDILNGPVLKWKKLESVASTARDNISIVFIAEFEQDVWAIFKVDKTGRGRSANEVAAYKIDRLLNLRMTPYSIERKLIVPRKKKPVNGSLVYFIKDSKLGGSKRRIPEDMKFFDYLINNDDRHENNWLIRDTSEVVAIDHNLAFGGLGYSPAVFTIPESEHIIDRLIKTKESEFVSMLAPLISQRQIREVLSNRKRLLKKIKKKYPLKFIN
jgi:hypothetical protein